MKRKAAFEINTYVGGDALIVSLTSSYAYIVPKTLPLGSGARSSWQPFTRIGRAKRVGHHDLQTPEHPTGLPDVAADGEEGDDVADEGYTGDGGEDVLPLEDYGVGVHEEAAGHLDEAEVLLGEGEAYADHKAGGEAEQGDEPAFEGEGAAEHLVGGPEAAVGLDVILFLDDEHRDAAEDIQGDDDDENEDQEYRRLLVTHHLVERRILAEAVQNLEFRA